jgi:TonB family protein
MAKLSSRNQNCLKAATLAVECLALACWVAAQTDSSSKAPAVVNRKEAATMILAQGRPEYPPLAKVNYIQGRVHIQVLVSPEGKVVEANVLEGHPFLAAAALRAVRNWVYRPLQTAAGNVAFVTLVDVNFSLRNTIANKLPPDPEKDLSRQVRPPEVLDKPPAHAPLLHVRVLINDEGQAIDVNPVEGFPAHYGEALKFAEHCKFQPARWGPLAVPWYLDVDVPLDEVPATTVGSRDM